MVLRIVQMDEQEYALLEAVLEAAHDIRVGSEKGEYRAALTQTDDAQKLRRGLGKLVNAAKAARPSTD